MRIILLIAPSRKPFNQFKLFKRIELFEPVKGGSPWQEFLDSKGEGIHHIAFEVENLEKIFQDLRSKGIQFVWDKIITGSRGSKVAFFKAEEFNGVYIELVQKH